QVFYYYKIFVPNNLLNKQKLIKNKFFKSFISFSQALRLGEATQLSAFEGCFANQIKVQKTNRNWLIVKNLGTFLYTVVI
ncbi:hypothetical protein BpHYR1_033500, partial [Brachionus plicatilis]